MGLRLRAHTFVLSSDSYVCTKTFREDFSGLNIIRELVRFRSVFVSMIQIPGLRSNRRNNTLVHKILKALLGCAER